MKTKVAVFVIVALLLVVAALPVAAVKPVDPEPGNGMPSGAHYQVNILGMKKVKNPEMKDNNGHRIFVWYNGVSKIWLTPGC